MRKLVIFTVPFAFAVLLYVYVLSLFAGILCSAIALIALVIVLVSHWKHRARAAIALGGLCFGFLFCVLYGQLFLQPVQAADGLTLDLTAELCAYPEQTRYGSKAETMITVNGRRAKMLLLVYEPLTDLRPGDRLRLRVTLQSAEQAQDREEYFYDQSKGISLIGRAKSGVTVQRSDHLPLRYWPVVLSRRISELLIEAMPEGSAGLIQALLTGDRSGLSYAQRSDFRMAGVSHMIAISGMHVSVLLVFLAVLTRKRRMLTAILGIPVVLLFVASTGCSPSAIRAAVMQILFLLAPLLGRENDPPTSLCAALLLLLLQNPYAIANLSLQLSFGAMAGILWATRPVYRYLTRPVWMQKAIAHDDPSKRLIVRLLRWLQAQLLKTVLVSVSTTLGAIVFTVPICAICLGSFSVYTLLSNLLILWAVELCFVGGLITVVLTGIWLPLGQSIGWLVAWPVRYVLWMSRLISGLPFALLTTDSPYLVIFLIICSAVIALGIGSRRVLLPTLGIVCGLVLTSLLTYLDTRPDHFCITAFDVGQGQSICMRTPGFSALYDCGGTGDDTAGQHVAEQLLIAGVRRLDAVVLSHYDEDHVGGLAQLLYRIDVDTLYLPPPQAEDGESEEILALAEAHQIKVVLVKDQMILPDSEGTCTVYPPVSEQSSNAGSLCILFSCAGYDMLATGDMDSLAERLLLYEWQIPQTELYIAGHHGSGSSSSEALLDVIRPDTVIVSVGDNRYGHPSQQALNRFEAVGATVYRTDECGDITIKR